MKNLRFYIPSKRDEANKECESETVGRRLIVLGRDFFRDSSASRGGVSLRLSLMKDGRLENASKEFCTANDSSGYAGLKPRSFCGSASSRFDRKVRPKDQHPCSINLTLCQVSKRDSFDDP